MYTYIVNRTQLLNFTSSKIAFKNYNAFILDTLNYCFDKSKLKKKYILKIMLCVSF